MHDIDTMQEIYRQRNITFGKIRIVEQTITERYIRCTELMQKKRERKQKSMQDSQERQSRVLPSQILLPKGIIRRLARSAQ